MPGDRTIGPDYRGYARLRRAEHRQTVLKRSDARLRQMLRSAGRTEPRVVRGIDDVSGARSEPGAEAGESGLETYRHACLAVGQRNGRDRWPRRKGVAARGIPGEAQCLEQGLERHIFPERDEDALVVTVANPPAGIDQVDTIGIVSVGVATQSSGEEHVAGPKRFPISSSTAFRSSRT